MLFVFLNDPVGMSNKDITNGDPHDLVAILVRNDRFRTLDDWRLVELCSHSSESEGLMREGDQADEGADGDVEDREGSAGS